MGTARIATPSISRSIAAAVVLAVTAAGVVPSTAAQAAGRAETAATGQWSLPEPPRGWCRSGSDDATECEIGGALDTHVAGTATSLSDGRVLVIGGQETYQSETWDGGEWHITSFGDDDYQVKVATQFSPTGEMVRQRSDHTATLLADGSVVVIGGVWVPEWTPVIVSQSERWDPATNAFEPVGDLAQPRTWHTATRLQDGRVLVVGGTDGDGALATAELWDPTTESFTPAGGMAHARVWHAAAPLPDGRVLVLGGVEGGIVLASAEIWDPATASFEAAPSLTRARAGHTAVALPDGRVLVAGGIGPQQKAKPGWWSAVAAAELWDPTSGSLEVSSTGKMDLKRAFHTSVPLADGRVMVIGGIDKVHRDELGDLRLRGPGECFVETAPETAGVAKRCAKYATAEIWDPDTGTFSDAGTFWDPRFGHASAALSDGHVLVVGGGDNLAQPTVWTPAAS